ncbi:MAG: DUF2330 domain-containing protein [Myxococcales bacterium]|nr:DUF2330 domain-containing protein [Myxococcales bacterium]
MGLSALLGSGVLLAPHEAEACGGTFCDAFTPDMPVDQTAEGILFVSDGDFVEAHVQIQYDGGDAQQFAWMVPVPAIPEIEVGSWRLLQTVLRNTQPVYAFEYNWACEDSGWDDGGGFIQDPDGGGASLDPEVGPNVVAQDTAGAFEYAILQGGSAETINTWLVANGYATDDQAPEILDTYLAEGSVFVAFKLRNGAQVQDIHPVVIRYPGREACIPLRLTRIAAKEDMDITAVFLGESRVVPTNFRHVELNPVRLNWLDPTTSYPELVTMAVDAPGADSRAFVTEYAGSSSVIDPEPLSTDGYDSSAFLDVPVIDVLEVLQDQGLADCDSEGCVYRHELVPSLLHEFIPVPPGIPEGDFYGCLSCYAQLIDLPSWDGASFAAAFDERIVAPLQHGQELLSTWPYATRLFTRMSPHEMIGDPTFEEVEGLPDVASRHGARRDEQCCGAIMRLPGGRGVTIDSGWQWPTFPAQMPWAERIEEFAPGGGAPVVLVDNGAQIDELLDAWNAAGPCAEEMGVDDDGTDTSAGGSDDDATGSAETGTSGMSGGQASAGLGDGGGGCGCTGGSRSSTPWLLLSMLGLGRLVRRRRRL